MSSKMALCEWLKQNYVTATEKNEKLNLHSFGNSHSWCYPTVFVWMESVAS